MKIGISLPGNVPGVKGDLILERAQRADVVGGYIRHCYSLLGPAAETMAQTLFRLQRRSPG